MPLKYLNEVRSFQYISSSQQSLNLRQLFPEKNLRQHFTIDYKLIFFLYFAGKEEKNIKIIMLIIMIVYYINNNLFYSNWFRDFFINTCIE